LANILFAAKRRWLYIFHRQVAHKYAGKKNDDQKKEEEERRGKEILWKELRRVT